MLPGRLAEDFPQEAAGSAARRAVFFGSVRLLFLVRVLILVLILRSPGILLFLQPCSQACIILDIAGCGTLAVGTVWIVRRFIGVGVIRL
jgi:hypothetical protein